jgi:hypothetical protein
MRTGVPRSASEEWPLRFYEGLRRASRSGFGEASQERRRRPRPSSEYRPEKICSRAGFGKRGDTGSSPAFRVGAPPAMGAFRGRCRGFTRPDHLVPPGRDALPAGPLSLRVPGRAGTVEGSRFPARHPGSAGRAGWGLKGVDNPAGERARTCAHFAGGEEEVMGPAWRRRTASRLPESGRPFRNIQGLAGVSGFLPDSSANSVRP